MLTLSRILSTVSEPSIYTALPDMNTHFVACNYSITSKYSP